MISVGWLLNLDAELELADAEAAEPSTRMQARVQGR